MTLHRFLGKKIRSDFDSAEISVSTNCLGRIFGKNFQDLHYSFLILYFRLFVIEDGVESTVDHRLLEKFKEQNSQIGFLSDENDDFMCWYLLV